MTTRKQFWLLLASVVAIVTAIGCSKDVEPVETGIVRDPATRIYTWKKMNDGKIWMVDNLNYEVPGGNSTWYNFDPVLGNEFGRLYDWPTAVNACAALGKGWRLPQQWEWNGLVVHNGGWDDPYVMSFSHSGFTNLIKGGSSGFNALLGGLRWPTGNFALLREQGYYWTSTEIAAGSSAAYMYVFRADRILERAGYDKQLWASCRCVYDE